MIGAWVSVAIWVFYILRSQSEVHPKAIVPLFFAEMWERFSFYGMRALLILYMTKELFAYLSQAEADEKAIGIYGAYGALVYGTPVIGGIIADRVLGFRKAIMLGAILMALGHFTMAIDNIYFFFI
ncbi:MAG: MFS transporter, partial [Bacteroidetes bacterium]